MSDRPDADELAAALRLLAGSTPYMLRAGLMVCFFCRQKKDHAHYCRWLRAARVLARFDASQEADHA